MDMKTVGPWAVRMLLLALGGWLTRTYAVGDATLWGNLADTLAGPLVVAGTAVWSWRATNSQVQGQTGAPAVVQAATQAAASASTAVDEIAALRRQVEQLLARPAA